MGAALGLLLASWGMGGLVALAPADTPGVESVSIDWYVLALRS